MRNHLTLGVLLAACVCVPCHAQDVCVPDPLVVDSIRGRIYFETNTKRQPLSEVTVEVAPYGYKTRPKATDVTKENGAFAFPRLRPGRYYLSVRHPVLIGLSVEVRMKEAKRPQREPTVIEIVLRSDPTRYCGGATATTLRETSQPRTRPK